MLPKARTKIKGNASKIPLNAIALGALIPGGQALPTGRIFSRWKNRNSFTTAWNREMARTAIKNLTFHDLKHTCLTRLQNLHVSYEVRQWLCGRKMKGETATYSHGGLGWDQLLRQAVTSLQLSDELSYKLSDELKRGVSGEGSDSVKSLNAVNKIGAEAQNRTADTSLFRAVLCQLSYLGTAI
jgi:hypothetical protein